MLVDQTLNHSAAHLLAAAVLKLYPDTKLGFGPAIDEGFYYDFAFSEPLVQADLARIEKEMHRLASGGYLFDKRLTTSATNQPFKDEHIAELKALGAEVTYYAMLHPSSKQVLFEDLCAGPHVKSTSLLKHFKLLNLAGAYWRGDTKNAQLTRIYGTAWATKEELDNYLKVLAERKERDHRKIGKDMNVFMFDLQAGQGFPFWLEDGIVIKNAIQDYLRVVERAYGFHEVSTPIHGAKTLYETSGHLPHYADTMFPVLKVDNEELVLRPMTCPHHILLYETKRRSYNELPLRYSEYSRLFRYEKSGALTGLERVRAMELTDAHIFARLDQVPAEFANAYRLILEVLTRFKIQIDYVSLSLRDPLDKDKYFPDDKMWDEAENSLRNVLKELNIKYEEKIGEAAFYGPKVDIQVRTALGHEITLSTLQLDFLLPRRFNLAYIDANETKVTPVLIHRGLIGTYERFIAILLEQTKGDLPLWLAPHQVKVIPVGEAHLTYAKTVLDKLVKANFRATLDERAESVARKIRDAQMAKVKYQLVIGDAEVAAKNISVRAYGSTETSVKALVEFIKELTNELKAS